MNWIKKNIVSSLTIFLIGIICLFLVNKFSWKGDDNKGYTRIISGDGLGYYMYLPNIFINNSISNQEVNNRQILTYKDKAINKYYVGTAITMLPFFTCGYYIASIQNDPLDGYSPPFQKAISIAAIFYLLIGLLFLKMTLTTYNINDYIISFTLILITFGTNLLIYVVESPSMSHVYSFSLISIFIFFSKKYFISNERIYFYATTILVALIILIRPIDGLIVFSLPFLAGSWDNLKKSFLFILNLKSLGFSLVLFSSIIFVQFYINYLQTTDFLVWNYKNEGFLFSNPQLLNVLFSFRKGFFIYTPIALLSFVGLVYLIHKNYFSYLSLLIFFVLLIYFTSSWWNWYYGPSLGQRSFTNFYSLNGILLALFFTYLTSKPIKLVLVISSVLLVGLNLVQSYQYNQKIISSWDMNFEKYKYTFLKTDVKYKNCLGGNNDIWLYQDNRKKIMKIDNDFEVNHEHTSTGKYSFEDSRQTQVCDYSNTEFNTSIDIPVDSNFMAKRGLFAEVSIDRYELAENSSSNGHFVIDVSDSIGNTYHYYAFKINEVPSNLSHQWKNYQYTIEITTIKNTTDKIKMYVWNKDKKPFYIDNLSVVIYSIN